MYVFKYSSTLLEKPCYSQPFVRHPCVSIYKCISKADRDFIFAKGFKKIEIFWQLSKMLTPVIFCIYLLFSVYTDNSTYYLPLHHEEYKKVDKKYESNKFCILRLILICLNTCLHNYKTIKL